MRMIARIRDLYRNTSYQNKLLLSYLVFILVPIIVLSLFSYSQSRAVITEQVTTIAGLSLKQATAEAEKHLSKMISLSQAMAQNSRVRYILEQDPSLQSLSQEYEDITELHDIANRVTLASEITNIRIYVNDAFRLSKRNILTYSYSLLDEAEWYYPENLNFFSSYITMPYTFRYLNTGTDQILSAVSMISSSQNFSKTIGIVTVDLPIQVFLDVLAHTDISEGGRAYLLDGGGKVVCGMRSTDQTPLTGFDAQDEQFWHTENVSVQKNNLLVAASEPIWGGWRILVVSPIKPLLRNAERLRSQMIIFSLLVGVIIYFLAWFYARGNAGRIRNLARKMRVVQSGDFNVNCIIDSTDEIGELQNNFNLMIQEIRRLMKEQYQMGQRLKESELRVLQAQINPHFLYNTLDLILWTAKNDNPDEISNIVIKLSRFYRLSLSCGEEFITIRDELEHVGLYVDLQNLRFKSKIRLETAVNPAAASMKIMKLLLQPIVENSILHGIRNLDDREGLIRITVDLQENGPEKMMSILINDNGVGMDQKTITRIMMREELHRKSTRIGSYGLHNIMERLRIYYGDLAGMTISSVIGQGTEVRVNIPVLEEEGVM